MCREGPVPYCCVRCSWYPGPHHSSQLIWPAQKTAALHSVAPGPSVGSDWDWETAGLVMAGPGCDWGGGGVRGRSKLVSNWSPAEAWTWTPVKLEQLKIESTEQSLHSNTRLGREGEFKLDSSLRNINIQRVKLWCNLMWEENVKMFTIIWFL